ncbi:MAG: 50S ribosomal protein L19 [Eubacterium sp.]|nr:50S ribosomal protein L19 [Eubacterium sp.]
MADEKVKEVAEEVKEDLAEAAEEVAEAVEETVEEVKEKAEEAVEAVEEAAEEVEEEIKEEVAEEKAEAAEETTEETEEATDETEEATEEADDNEEAAEEEPKEEKVPVKTHELIKDIEESQKKEVANFKVGDTVVVSAKITEGNRERIQKFEGLVIKKQGGGNRTTFTVRKDSNGVGVEKTWPLYSPTIAKIEVTRAGKVRRAKLNYIKDRVGKAAKVKRVVK